MVPSGVVSELHPRLVMVSTTVSKRASENTRLSSVAWIVLLWVIALAPRLLFVWVADPSLGVDEQVYLEVAQNYLHQGCYRSAHDLAVYGLEQVRPPLVPWLLFLLLKAGASNVLLLRSVFAVLCSLVVIPLYLFARRLGASRVQARLCAGIASLHPYLVLNASRLLTEDLFSLLVVAAMASLAGWRQSRSWAAPMLGGLWLGLAALCRPTVLPLVFLLPFLWWVLSDGRFRWFGLVASLCAGLTVAPWTLSLHQRYDAWIPITSSGAYNLWNANNPWMKPDKLVTQLPDAMKERMAGLSEKERMAYLRNEALSWARSHPREFWLARWRSLAGFWKLLPADLWNQRSSFQLGYLVRPPRQAVVVAGKLVWFAMLDLLFIAFILRSALEFRSRRPEIASLLACLLVATAVHTVMTGYDRYRYPFDPLWTTVGMTGILALVTSRIQKGRAGPRKKTFSPAPQDQNETTRDLNSPGAKSS
ncbi:MAG: glycosyltransferase family 39 protein [Verrucomicrobiota bacterium]